MGVYALLRRATPADAARLRAEPALVSPFLYGGDAADRATARPAGIFGFVRRLFSARTEGPDAAPAADAPAEAAPAEDAPAEDAPAWPPAAGELLDLEKDWHALHFLLTGRGEGGAAPACYLLEGGEDVGDDGSGEPVARLLDPAQVRAFAAFVGALSRDEAARRYDPARMAALDIYPREVWARDEVSVSYAAADGSRDRRESPLPYLLDHFAALQAFLGDAAAAGDAVAVAVS